MNILAEDAWKRPWFGPMAPYGRPTGDRRIFTPGSLGHRELPMPIMLQTQTAPNHFGAVTVGSVRAIAQTSQGSWGMGTWLDPKVVPEVNRALGLMAGGVAFLSPDLEPGTLVIGSEVSEDGTQLTRYDQAVMSGVTIVPIGAFDQRSLGLFTPETVPDGLEFEIDEAANTFGLTGTTSWRSMPIAPREMKFDADSAVARILAWANGSDEKARTMFLYQNPEAAVGTRARWNLPVGDILNGKPHMVFHAVYAAAAIMSGAHGGMTRLTDTERRRIMGQITEMYQRMAGAFNDPALEAPWVKREKLPNRDRASMTASAAPVAPPADWFVDDGIDGPLTVTPDGRVFGLLARWDTCHTAYAAHGNCVTPPRSRNGYQSFTTGTLIAADGNTIPIGRITIDTTHPIGEVGASMTASQAAAHYDHTGSQVAVVAAGENRHGIWVSGALTPEASEEQIARLRRSPLSGDWRDVNGNLELVAALAVNSPGFPVVRINGGNRFSLTASAAVLERCPGSTDDLEQDVVNNDPMGEDITTTAKTETSTDGEATPPEAGETSPGGDGVDLEERIRAILGDELRNIGEISARRAELDERLDVHRAAQLDTLIARFEEHDGGE